MVSDFHEEEIVELRASTPLDGKILHKSLKNLGLKAEDDFYFLDRADSAKPWESIDLFSVEIFLGSESVGADIINSRNKEKVRWDRIQLSYLLASLPAEFIDDFTYYAYEIADKLGLNVYYNSIEVEKQAISALFKSYAKDLTESYSDPGSELLAIVIQATYPR